MRAYILQLSGEALEIDVEPSASVQELQVRAQALNPAGGHVKLALRDKVLLGTNTLADSGVEDGALISLIAIAPSLYVLTADDDGTAKLWSIESGACVRTFAGHEDG